MKFHVTFDESKKLLDLKVLNISSFKDALAGLWCDKNFHDALIQWYMPEIDDWVDLDSSVFSEWSKESNTIRKIRVMEQHRTSPFDLDSTQQSLVSDSVMESDSQNSSKGIVSSIESKEIANSSKTASIPPDWPHWPDYAISRDVLQRLERELPLNKTHQMRICDGFYNDAVKYNVYYPKSIHYEKMADCVLHTFPHLVGQNTYQDSKIYWKEKLKYKFQNNRRRQDKDVRICVARKRKGIGIKSESEKKNRTSPMQEESTIASGESSSHEFDFCSEESEKTELFGEVLCGSPSSNFSEADPFARETCTPSPTDGFTSQKQSSKNTFSNRDKSRCSNQYGLRDYLPGRPQSETDETIVAHINNMKKEWKKRDHDQMKINTLMDLTFADRRKLIVNQAPDVAQVLEDYPVLTEGKELLKEFMRLKPSTEVKIIGLEEQITLGLSKHKHSLIHQLGRKSLPSNLNSLQCSLERATEKAEKQYLSNCMALMAVPCLMGEKSENLLDFHENDHSNKLCFVSFTGEFGRKQRFLVHIEGQIYKCDNLINAVSVLLAGIYVFNIRYPQNLQLTWTFFQRVILGIQDESKMPKKIVSLLSCFN